VAQDSKRTPDLRALEEKINKRVASSIEDLGELMKMQAKKFRK